MRWYLSALSGKYFQQHAPVRKQTVPVGHSVRFGYLETAITMLAREGGDKSFIPTLEKVWEHMITRRMYVTGGIGSQPGLEGFGNDYELDPEYAYNETCAALASMFWNWEMAQLTHQAKYSDLLEWQLYNAAAVGMGLDGTSYLYNNPLTCRGGVTRRPWYSVPCCPSNLSRTWANLGKYIVSSGVQSPQTLPPMSETSESATQKDIWIHQYISSQFENDFAKIELHSEFPWIGKVEIILTPSTPSAEFTLHLRIPSWSLTPKVELNKQKVKTDSNSKGSDSNTDAQGYDPHQSRWLSIHRTWNSNDVISLAFDMPIQFRRAHPKVKGHNNKVAATRGPLVYCLESVDNKDVDIFNAAIDTESLEPVFDSNLLGEIVKIYGQTKTGKPLIFIPYHLWGNRGESTMTVWVNK